MQGEVKSLPEITQFLHAKLFKQLNQSKIATPPLSKFVKI